MAETHVVLNVPTVSCNHCKMAIEKAVGAVAGVELVEVDVAEKTVTVDFDTDAVSLESVEKSVSDEGYEVAGRHVFGDLTAPFGKSSAGWYHIASRARGPLA